MTLPAPKIVIFDMDGTTVRHINPKLLGVLERLDDFGYACSRFKNWIFRRHAQGPVFQEGESFQAKKQPRLIVHRTIHKLRRKPVEQIVEPCPGIYSVLSFLQKKNIPTALVSNGLGRGYGHDILKTFGLEKYFGATVFREDIEKSKPNPQPLLLGLERLSMPMSDDDIIWYIGDRHKDIAAALAANDHIKGTFIPLAYGWNAASAVIEKQLGLDHIITSYFDLYDVLDEKIPY